MAINFAKDDEYIECNLKDIKNSIEILKQNMLKMESAYKIFNQCHISKNFKFQHKDFEFFALNFQVQFVELVEITKKLNREINYLLSIDK